jgi:hypothetical protein
MAGVGKNPLTLSREGGKLKARDIFWFSSGMVLILAKIRIV